MSFLLDTNVISEWMHPRPNRGVVIWLATADEDRVFISVVTLAELRHGIERLAQGARRNRLDRWLREELPLRFEDRVLTINAAIADSWGKIMARGQAAGRPIGPMDAFIAATADIHGLTVVTRNTSEFDAVGVPVLAPWTAV